MFIGLKGSVFDLKLVLISSGVELLNQNLAGIDWELYTRIYNFFNKMTKNFELYTPNVVCD